MINRLPAWLIEKLDSCPQTGGGVHNWLFCTARQLLWHLPPEQVFGLLKAKSSQCGRAVPEREIIAAINDAARVQWRPGDMGDPGHQPEPRVEVKYEPAYAEAIAAKTPAASNPEWFLERSALTCPNRSVAGFLHVVFEPGETVFITTDFYATSESEKAWLWTNPSPLEQKRLELDCLDFLKTGQSDVWYLCNPVNGHSHCDNRLRGGQSFRCIETITSWRHYVIETDIVPDAMWLPILAQLPLRIRAIYHSGKRGYHALGQIDASSKEQAEKRIAELEPHLVQLGACPGTLTPHRLTRLPNCVRTYREESSGKEIYRQQRLIYLNPSPNGQPISQLPTREPPWFPWLRWAETLIPNGPLSDKKGVLVGLQPFAGQDVQVDQAIQNLQNSL